MKHITKGGIAKEEANKIRPPRTSLTLRTLVSFSPPARSPHSSVPRSLLPAEPRCQSYSLIETLTTCNSPFPSPTTRRGPCWPHPPNILLEPRSQDMWGELQVIRISVSATIFGAHLRNTLPIFLALSTSLYWTVLLDSWGLATRETWQRLSTR